MSAASLALAAIPLEYVGSASELASAGRVPAAREHRAASLDGAKPSSEMLHALASDVLDALDESVHRLRTRVPALDRSLHSIDSSLRGT